MVGQIKKLGFTTAKSSGIAFIGKTQVIKYSYLVNMREKRTVPTTFLTPKRKHYYFWLVQPKVKILTPKEYDKHAAKIEVLFSGSDDQRANLCFYRRSLRAIDW